MAWWCNGIGIIAEMVLIRLFHCHHWLRVSCLHTCVCLCHHTV